MKKKIFFYEDMVAMNEKSNKKIYAFRGKNGQDREKGSGSKLNKVIKMLKVLVS